MTRDRAARPPSPPLRADEVRPRLVGRVGDGSAGVLDAVTGGAQPRAGGAHLLVDAANVVGSRPDGWWRDRAGAAARLVDRLAVLPGAALDGVRVERVTVVLEGRARAGAAPTPDAPVRVVHAPGSGDDALVELCAPGVLLVTADRELRARAQAAGAHVASPRRLLEALPP